MPAITIRELVASDRRAVVFTFGRLGERSRYQRYLMTKDFLTPRELQLLLGVDHWHHEALIAFSPPPRAPIGIARYVRLDDFDVAEVAVEVVDRWQRRGVGTALVQALRERALRAGIRTFRVSMLRDNKAARALADRLGPAAARAAAGSVLELSYSLSVASSDRFGSREPASWPPSSSPPSAPTATGVGFGAGSITVSLTSASAGGSPPSSPAGQSTLTIEPEGTCDRSTKSASGSST
jgi:RimJ/RimL family protein N-acetyltransferase